MPTAPKTGASHRHLKRLKNSAYTPSISPEMAFLERLNTTSLGRLECAWHGAWSAPGTALQMALGLAPKGPLEWPCCTPWMTLLECLKQRQTTPFPTTGLAPKRRPSPASQVSSPSLVAAFGRHLSSRRCKEDTVPSFYALRLVFILFRFSPIRFGETN